MAVRDILHASLIKHEGFRSKPYKDTAGIWTIGYGHNIEEGISQKSAMALLDEDIDTAAIDAKKLFPNLSSFSANRQAAIIELVFNMGLGTFSKFTSTIAAIRNESWQQAADHLLDSLWAKQVKGRANDIATMIAKG